MCYSTTLDRDLAALEKRLNRRLIDELRPSAVPGDAGQVLLPLARTSAFARPLWPVIGTRHPQHLDLMRWGLLPGHIRTEQEAREFMRKAPTFNAVSEEVEHKRTFKHAFENGQRCLVPVTGFFEWRHEGKSKVPYRIGAKDGDVFCLGGLWEKHRGAGTYTVLTTRANPLMAFIHNTKQRMPVIIAEADQEAWLSPDLPLTEAKRLCEPVPQEMLEAEALVVGPVQGELF